jgi:hypothetical protein
MDSRLSEEKLNELLPGLKQLAELISSGESFDRRALRDIASSIGLDGQEWALTELELWSHILMKSKDVAYTEDAIMVELRNRGIPEFPARLACKSAKPKPLKVEPQFVDFGNLQIGERAEPRMITVSGGPIIKAISGSRIKVTLLDAGHAKTLVRVELIEGTAGEILKDEIILRSNTGELRVSVAAHWAAEPPLLSWCPDCGPEHINKKSLFYNKYAKQYECFRCKHEFPYSDKRVSEYNKTHK